MVTSESQVCQQVLDHLRSSNLNFLVTETPFSATINVRKRFLKSSQGSVALSNLCSTEAIHMLENESLKNEVVSLREALNQSEVNHKSTEETCSILEQKISKIEAAALKAFEEKNSDVTTLKNVIKNNKSENMKLKSELNQLNKTLKSKEKETRDLQKSNINKQDSIRALKEGTNQINDKKHKLEKEVRKLEKKVSNLGKTENNNLLPKPSLCSVSTSLSSTPPITSLSFGPVSLSNHSTNSSLSPISKNLTPIPSISLTPLPTSSDGPQQQMPTSHQHSNWMN